MHKVIERKNSTKNRIALILEEKALIHDTGWKDEIIQEVKNKTQRTRRITQVLDNKLEASQAELQAFAEVLDVDIKDLLLTDWKDENQKVHRWDSLSKEEKRNRVRGLNDDLLS